MSDAVKIALIATIVPSIASLTSIIVSLLNRRKIDHVNNNVNGKMSELIEARKETAFLEGAAQERTENRERVLAGDDTLSGKS